MRRGLLIGILVAVLIGAAWWFLIMSPIGERIATAEADLAAAQSEELQLQTRLAELRRINDNLLEYQVALADMEASIPANPQMDMLVDELARLADDSGVRWVESQYSNPADPSDTGYREITLAMTVEGQYFEVLGYLYGISELDRLLRVDGLQFDPTLDASGFNILNVTINATAFTRSDVIVPEVGEIVDPTPPTTTTSSTTSTTVDGATTTTTAAG